MLFLGIDQHARQLTVLLRDQQGDVLLARKVSTRPDKVLEFFDQLNRRLIGQDVAKCDSIIENTEGDFQDSARLQRFFERQSQLRVLVSSGRSFTDRNGVRDIGHGLFEALQRQAGRKWTIS